MSMSRCARQRLLDEAIHRQLRLLKKQSPRRRFLQLLTVVQDRSSILDTRRFSCNVSAAVQTLAKMCRHGWRRSPSRWKSSDPSSHVQFRSLVEHLFAEYPIPPVLANAWLDPDFNGRGWRWQLFQQACKGKSLRLHSLPIQLSKSMAKALYIAPSHLSVSSALRWAQVIGLGGDKKLAEATLYSWLRDLGEAEDFRDTLLRFLVRNLPKPSEELLEAIFCCETLHSAPKQLLQSLYGIESFTLKGRTWQSLARMRHQFEHYLAEQRSLGESLWKSSGIKTFRIKDGATEWQIVELRCDRQLRIEGRMMKHCVAKYAQVCSQNQSSIWSVRMVKNGSFRRQATVELLPRSKMIMQIKAKLNFRPEERTLQIVQSWAKREGLTIIPHCLQT